MNFVIHFLSAILICFAAITSGLDPPVFSTEFYVEGTFYRPLRDWEVEFRAYYDLSNKRSRIDYNDGTGNWTRTYQIPKNDSGTLYKFTLASDAIRKIYNFPICFKMTGTDYIQNMLPFTNGYNYESQVEFKGEIVEVYVNTFTLPPLQFYDRYWVNWEDNTKTKPIPLRFERITYNIGSNYTNAAYGTDRWLIDYHAYKPGLLEATAFQIEGGEKCIDVYKDDSILNPFGNFINQVTFKDNSGSGRDSDDYSDDDSSYNYNNVCNYIINEAGFRFGEKEKMGVRFNWDVERETSKFEFENYDDLPDQVDLRLLGVIFPDNDQLYCKASYAFVAASIVEGVHYQRTGVLYGLSRQALIDASFDSENDEANQGCNGGSIGYSLKWIKEMSGLPLAGDYKRYMAMEGHSELSNINFVAPISEFYKIKKGSVDDIKKALFKHGPVGAIVNNARATSFLFYGGGIYKDTECNDNTSNGAMQSVLIVGYGKSNGSEYWIVKNSWSPHWGIDGYIYISIKGNICGILDNAWFAVSAIENI